MVRVTGELIGPSAASYFDAFLSTRKDVADEAPAREAPWLGVLGLSTAVRDYTPHALDDMIGRASTMV